MSGGSAIRSFLTVVKQHKAAAFKTIRVLFFLACCVLIWNYIRQNPEAIGRMASASHRSGFYQWLVPVLLLAPLNWYLESEKFRLLVTRLSPIGRLNSFRAYLTGTAVSLFTPNRSGEFAGKVLYLPPAHRAEGALLAIVGSTAQLLVTIQAGCVALPLLYNSTNLVLMLVLAGLAGSLLWFFLPEIAKAITHVRLPNSIRSAIAALTQVTYIQRSSVWALSVLRYMVFCLQQLLLFRVFGAESDPQVLLPLIASVYLVSSLVPNIGIAELAFRNAISLYLYADAGIDMATVYTVTT
ncbi:MAG: hypothetical protein ACKOQY_00675, partial [Bacteroidota bacterium]